MTLNARNKRGGLPIALGGEAVAVGHQALRGEARQLVEAVEVLERGGESLEAAGDEELAQSEFLARRVAQARVTRAAFGELGNDLIELGVFVDQLRRPPVLDAVDPPDQVADAVAVARKTEAHFGRHLVAFGDRDRTHIVAETAECAALPVMPGARGAHPGADALLRLGVGPMTDDDFAIEAHARVDEPRFAVAVRRLIEVHEIHVDGVPRQLAIELGVEMEERLLEQS